MGNVGGIDHGFLLNSLTEEGSNNDKLYAKFVTRARETIIRSDKDASLVAVLWRREVPHAADEEKDVMKLTIIMGEPPSGEQTCFPRLDCRIIRGYPTRASRWDQQVLIT
jgi:hypothetical protein